MKRVCPSGAEKKGEKKDDEEKHKVIFSNIIFKW